MKFIAGYAGICSYPLITSCHMTKKFNTSGMIVSIAAAALVTGCAGGGYANNGMAGLGYPAQSGTGYNALGAIENVLINSVAQSMAGSVLNGQIGSQLPAADQNFRLQQLNGMVQSGAVNQSQQWVNPQTGSAIALNPLGQSVTHPQTQQQCQNMQEVVTLPNGQSITENRQACFNPQTGKWNLVQ